MAGDQQQQQQQHGGDDDDDAGEPLVDAAGHRRRGRLPSQMRPLLSERAVLERADGSAKWVQDGTAVLAAVHGPRMAGQRREDAERAVIEVALAPRGGVPGSAEREAEEQLRGLLEGVVLRALHPRTAILVALQVLQADGSLLAAAVNAACGALADAGVPMRCLVAGAAVAFGRRGELVLDPDAAEEAAAAAVVTAAYGFARRRGGGGGGGEQQGDEDADAGRLHVPDAPLLLHTRGRLQPQQLATALATTRAAAEGVAKFVHLGLVRGLKEALVEGGALDYA